MGRHSSPEPTEKEWTPWMEGEPKRPGRLVRVWAEYCQPFYKRYRKSLVAAGGAALTTLFAVYTDGISQEELIFILVQAGAAAGVWRVPNATNKKVVKK